jgi:DNA primase
LFCKVSRANIHSFSCVETKVAKEEDMDFSSLMDRFRGRLVVPIFDAMGKHVLGFGGRILQQAGQQQSDFKAPKYLNSPESPVFSKKTLLFGHHMAKDAVQESKSSDERASSVGASVVIVEGYMDAIALWQAGVRETVACMGTALTSEQVGAAAKTAGARGGRVIICLDNDDAGITAVERICSGSILSSVAQQYVVEIRIASLPKNVKDPAEYLENYNKQKEKMQASSAADEFRKEVLDTSVEWTEWYIDRILGQYDSTALRGAAGSFGDLFERVAEFLATFKNAADRTKRACEVAASLADIMAKESDSPSMSNTVRIQLESDLVDKASRIANSRDAVARRIESVDGGSDADVQAKLSNVARGTGLSGGDDKEKFSWKKLKEDPENRPKIIPGPLPSKKKTVSMRPKDKPNGPEKQQYQRRTYKPRNAKEEAPILTPHFAGFEFANDSDAEWLGLSKEKVNLLVPEILCFCLPLD